MPTTTDWRQALPWLDNRGLCLLPIGAKPPERKAPVDPDTGYGLRNWQHSTGYTVADLAAMNPAHVIAVGINTGHGGILVVDIDGKSAAEWIKARGLDPLAAGTWTVARDTDPDRYKLIFRLTPEQQALFPQTKLLLRTVKGEALEIYYQPGAQVLVLGQHCKSGGNYTWGGTPADIATPSAEWMDIFAAIAEAVAELRSKGDTSKPPRIAGVSINGAAWTASGHGRPCPICARERSAACTWSISSDGRRIVTCFHGSADHTPPSGLKSGGVITGRDGNQWAFVRDYFAECLGEKSLFIEHQQRPQQPQQQPPEPWQAPQPQAQAAALSLAPQDAIDDEIHRILCLPSNDHTRHDAINAVLRSIADLVEATQDGDTLLPDFIDRVCQTGAGRREAKKVIKDRRIEIQQERREAVKLQRLQTVRAQAAVSPDPILQLISALPTPPDGKIDAGTPLGALRPQQQNAFRLRFNLMFRAIELDGAEIPEHTVELAHVQFQAAGWKVGKNDTIDALVGLARESSYHPVEEYLRRLETDDSIPMVDIDKLATTYLRTSDPLYDAMLRVNLIGAVKRIFEPGCQHDTVLVLQGAQGGRKTSFWRILAGNDWYSASDDETGKERKIKMHSFWIVELGELEHVTSRHAVGALRQTITTTTDDYRPVYGKANRTYPRRFILVASVNPDDFLVDPEGNRRFEVIPISAHEFDALDTDALARDRDSIWKTVTWAYRLGYSNRLTKEEKIESNSRNNHFDEETGWDGLLARLVKDRIRFSYTGLTIDQILVASGCRKEEQINPHSDHRKAGAALRKLGCTKEKTQDGGVRSTLWFPPGKCL